MARQLTQAVIFAGGKGERLQPLTKDRPKPMVEIRGRPFLEYLIALLRENGIANILILLGYLPERIIEHFGDGRRFGVHITYHTGTVEEQTATRLKNAAHLLDEHFLLLYCDNYWPLNLEQSWKAYRAKGAPVMMTVYDNRLGGGEYGPCANVAVDERGYVSRYGTFVPIGDIWGVDIGFFITDRRVVERISSDVVWGDFTKELIPSGEVSAFITRHPYCTLTNPEQLERSTRFLSPKKVVFLDRDGILNKRMPPHEYVRSWDEFEFLPDAKDALVLLARKGYQIFVVTNQRGIARGAMEKSDVEEIHRRLREEATAAGAEIRAVYVCPHEDGDGCDCRKPKPGMLFRAAHDHHLVLPETVLIGDEEADILAGEAAGCRTILLKSGMQLRDIAAML